MQKQFTTEGRRATVCASAIYIVLCALCLLVPQAQAQTANAAITGTITDATGSAVPGAQISAVNVATGIKRTAVSDTAGRYTITNLVPGAYDILAEKEGFAASVARNQELAVEANVTEDLILKVSGVVSTVEVSAAAPLIETTQASVSTVVATREIDTLPILARSFASLAALTPGVTSSGVIGNTTAYQTGYVADGITNETGNQGNQYAKMAQDWVQEFSVQTLQFPAEYGNASGGVINAATRSGGNDIHGRVYGFYQNVNLNSNPSNFTGTSKLPFSSRRIGGMAGGPIKKNKLFYFAGYENFYQSQATTRSSSFLTADGGAFNPVIQPSNEPINQLVPWLPAGTGIASTTYSSVHLAMLKLDYEMNDKTHFTLRGNLDFEPSTTTGYGGAGPYGGASGRFSDPYSVIVGLTRVISTNTVTDFRAGYFQNGRGSASWSGICSDYPGNAAIKEPYNYITTEALGGATPWGNPDGYFAGVSYSGVSTGGGGWCGGIQNNDGAAVLQDTTTFIRGAHEVKAGVVARRGNLWSRSAQNSSAGSYTFASSAGPFDPNAAIAQNLTAAGFTAAQKLAPISYSVLFNGSPGLTTFSFHYYSAGAFVQDTWKIRRNLTLNMGLRYDFSNMNSSLGNENWPALQQSEPGAVGFIPPGYHRINNDPFDLAPRFGFAWTPFKDSHTVIRGGVGVFYNANDGASAGIYITSNSWATYDYILSANTATTNPYCIGTTACAGGAIPPQYEIAVSEVLASALANMTLPQFPLSSAACAKTNSCTVRVGGNTYTIPALNVNYMPSGGRVDLAPNVRVPGTMQATVGIQHQFKDTLTVSTDYVHHIGFNGLVPNNTNVGLTGPGATSSYVIVNPAFTSQYQLQSVGSQTADDLQVKANLRDRHKDRINVAYQFGYSHDNSETSFGISAHSALVNDPFDLNYDYGPSSSDLRHTLSVSGVIPLLFGVELAPLFTAASGTPYTATSNVQKPGSSLAPANCLPYFTNCYPYANGVQYSRDSLRGTATWNLDARLQKTVRLGERRSATFMFEAYNVFNHWNIGTSYYSNVDITSGPQAFGRVNLAQATLRQLQLGARFDF